MEIDKPLAKFTPTIKEPINPGPFVTPITEISFKFTLASFKHFSKASSMLIICCLDANSGIIPP